MSSLWCHHAAFPGTWVAGNGFNQVLPSAFRNMTDLRDLIRRSGAAAGPSASIERLGIIVHGEEGELRTGSSGSNLVTPERIETDTDLRKVLSEIGDFLRPNATVEFYSCSAAASERGSRLLIALSLLWPGRTVVGAVSKGYRFATLTAGNVQDTLLTVIEQLPRTDRFCIPGQSVVPGRSDFYLPVGLPRFLSVAATLKKARDGAIVHMPSGPAAFREFELRYPAATRSLILTHAGLMYSLSRSDAQFYATYLINMDWPRNFGRNALIKAPLIFPNY